jgi:hypothetical protein
MEGKISKEGNWNVQTFEVGGVKEKEGKEHEKWKTKSVMPISLTFLSYQLVRTICLLPVRFDNGFRLLLCTASVLRHSLKQKIQTSVHICAIIGVQP